MPRLETQINMRMPPEVRKQVYKLVHEAKNKNGYNSKEIGMSTAIRDFMKANIESGQFEFWFRNKYVNDSAKQEKEAA